GFVDQSILGTEFLASISQQKRMGNRQIDGHISYVDVAPINHAAQHPLMIDQDMSRIEIALNKRLVLWSIIGRRIMQRLQPRLRIFDQLQCDRLSQTPLQLRPALLEIESP